MAKKDEVAKPKKQLTQIIEYVDVKKLAPSPKNPRRMKEDQFKILMDSIKSNPAYFETRPIIYNKDGIIIAGNMRYKAAVALGYTDVPATLLDCTPEMEDEIMIRDNRQNGEWDMEILANLFDPNKLLDWGFNKKELDFSMVNRAETVGDDDVPEKAPARTKVGDIYEINGHRLMCGDSTSLTDVQKLMNGAKADLIVTDPPYNVDYVGKTKDALKIQNDKMDNEQFYNFLLDVHKNLFEIAKDGTGIYVFHADSEGLNFRKALIDAGFKLAQCCVWVKQTMVMGRQDYHWQHEPVLYGWKPTGSHNWYTDRKQTTVWKFDRPSRSEDHPTTKPIALVEYPVLNSSKKFDIVVDLFGGSGSCMVACEKNDRVNYSMEISPQYCDIIVKRFSEFCKKNGRKCDIFLNGVSVAGE